jgi:alpha-ribazole phosphatase
MKWYFLRHAETHANIGRVYNPTNDELTPTGQEQARAAAAYIQALPVDGIYCSPLARTQETARLLGVSPTFVDALADRKFGAFSGKPYGSLGSFCEEQGVDTFTYVPQNGESIAQSHNRVQLFLNSLADGTYLFITHGAVIDYVVHSLAGRAWDSISSENVSLWVFEDGVLTHENWRPWESTPRA